MVETAFVFIQLPGQTRATVAGRFELNPDTSPQIGEFVYGQSYRANSAALALDPIALPLKQEIFRTTLGSGFFGVFRDAIPDDWGQHVASRLYGNHFKTLFDYLWLSTSDRMGALSFGHTSSAPEEEKPPVEWEDVLDSVYLEAIQKLDRDTPLTPAEHEIAVVLGAGTTAGGARPKFATLKDSTVCLAKLNRHNDRFNEVRVEAGMLDLADACGINVPAHEVVHVHGQDVLLVDRFDRAVSPNGIQRHRMVSAATVFQADEAAAQYAYTGSYPRFSRELARWTVTGDKDRRQLFRRIAFNALTSATDDHERNHALVAEGAHFRLSPAFDLVPKISNTRRRHLSLVIGEYGSLAIRENLLSSAEVFQLSRDQADTIINEVQQVVRAQWRTCLVAQEVRNDDIERVAACFNSPAFEDPPPDRAVL
jgi:serine/threonine-protein kinase HipA